MEQYKLINAELMDQVQRQRILIGQMVKTEVLLKKQLFEERETRLCDAQYNENKLKCAIRTLLQSLDLNLDSSIIPPHSIRSSGDNTQSAYSRKEACSELRRSSALLRRSVVPSPTRRSHSTNSVVSCNGSQTLKEEVDNTKENISPTIKDEKIRRTPEPRRLVDLQANMSSPDSPEAEKPLPDQESPPRTNAAAIMYSVIEECESEEEESLPISVDDTDTERRSMELSTLPLCRNVSNTNTLHLESPKTFSLKHIEHNETENRCAPDERKSILDNREHQLRCSSRQSSPMHLTVLRSSLDFVPSPKSRPSQLNFSAFNGIVNRPDDSSTPQRNQKDTKAKKKAKPRSKPRPTKSTTGCSESQVEASCRPSRSCRPKSLKETSCRTKMRNESNTC